eukprot:6211878-Pleurochrysis_carterae.AAC.2
MRLTAGNLKKLRREQRRQQRRNAEERERQAQLEREEEEQRAQLAREEEERIANRAAQLKSLRAEKVRYYMRVGASFLPASELGFSRRCGGTETCLVDAVANAIQMMGIKCSGQALRSRAQGKLGEDGGVNWDEVTRALSELNIPVRCEHASRFFQSGPPMLQLLNSRKGFFVVFLKVTVDEKKYMHAVAYDAPRGVLVDNHSQNRPVLIDERDRKSRNSAKRAFQQLIGQRRSVREKGFSLDVDRVFELLLLGNAEEQFAW